jgi:hypothetical protein
MLSDPGIPTLDQLRVFLTVADTGSFAGAARRLGRATSVISYSIANLEAQLGVLLFDRESTRKPQLTEAGRTVLSEARTLSNDVNGLRARVRGLLQGVEAKIPLVLDVMLPAARRRRAEGVSSGVSDGVAAPLCRSARRGDANGTQPHGHDRARWVRSMRTSPRSSASGSGASS